MTDTRLDLQDALVRSAQNQLVMINLLRQQGHVLAEIHQLVSPPEQTDAPSLRDILIRLVEGFDRQEEAIRLLSEQIAQLTISRVERGAGV